MYKHNTYYEIYDHQLLKTQALKSENPKAVVFTTSKDIQNPSHNMSFT